MSNAAELQQEYSQLEHEWFVAQNCDHAITAEFVTRLMKLAKDAVDMVDDAPVAADFEEMRKELKHRMKAEMDCALVELGRIIDEEVL